MEQKKKDKARNILIVAFALIALPIAYSLIAPALGITNNYVIVLGSNSASSGNGIAYTFNVPIYLTAPNTVSLAFTGNLFVTNNALNSLNSGGTGTTYTANLPLSISPTNIITISQASSTTNGFITSNDYTTFLSKLANIIASIPLSFNSITSVVSCPTCWTGTNYNSVYLTSTYNSIYDAKISAVTAGTGITVTAPNTVALTPLTAGSNGIIISSTNNIALSLSNTLPISVTNKNQIGLNTNTIIFSTINGALSGNNLVTHIYSTTSNCIVSPNTGNVGIDCIKGTGGGGSPGGSQYNVQTKDGSGGFYGDGSFSENPTGTAGGTAQVNLTGQMGIYNDYNINPYTSTLTLIGDSDSAGSFGALKWNSGLYDPAGGILGSAYYFGIFELRGNPQQNGGGVASFAVRDANQDPGQFAGLMNINCDLITDPTCSGTSHEYDFFTDSYPFMFGDALQYVTIPRKLLLGNQAYSHAAEDGTPASLQIAAATGISVWNQTQGKDMLGLSTSPRMVASNSSICAQNFYYGIYNGTTCSGTYTASPAGSNKQIQFNNNGASGASSAFTFNTVGNNMTETGNSILNNEYLTGTNKEYNSIATKGEGVIPIYASNRIVGATGNAILVRYATPQTGAYAVGFEVTVQSYTSGTLYANVVYIDDSGTTQIQSLESQKGNGLALGLNTKADFDGFPTTIYASSANSITIQMVSQSFSGSYNAIGYISEVT